ncbi:MAG: hypothetical protein R3B82_17205 [Sandaracinaceae bacterium]
MKEPISPAPRPRPQPRHRDAWLPPPPPPRAPDAEDERARREALAELADLITELERWRRRQVMRKPVAGAQWVFARSRDGVAVRIRFVDGEPAELRTTAADRAHACAVASDALDRGLALAGSWQHDGAALDWYAPVRWTV